MLVENPKILLVEDDEFLVQLIAQELIRSGFTNLTLVKDGGMVMQKFQEIQPDLILLDILLPVKSGLEALREIRATDAGKKVLVMVLSNFNDPAYKTQAEQLNVKGYLIKANHTMNEIVDQVKEVLAKA
ncbi:MAG: hypothetical protein A3I44_01960 [Candidatus Sungbacteria bacterium RIFCSPLOWO2_02_FULL_51_17]|nr:MAG: hypothetical protein A2676_04100 [Candidatus Sungbacteria bacterium RIFCSPHIGHO2_01_FULL_51_22]OHA07841.1 MAG: hypothetical protein A3B29_00705 [Candidatus Sungbacteria bacterium RIFCSPLOWO2_01_FULL_51_34]OHA11425.1 MAG: hypothetical protein A3I44_01960 [Candidatus Sungbacteria bacterium RIFCSPLOWO2_02_FULL_51_17]